MGHVERMGKERGPVKALHFQLDGTEKDRPKKKW